MDKSCDILKDDAIGVINFEQKNLSRLFSEKLLSYLNSKVCYIFEELCRILRF